MLYDTYSRYFHKSLSFEETKAAVKVTWFSQKMLKYLICSKIFHFVWDKLNESPWLFDVCLYTVGFHFAVTEHLSKHPKEKKLLISDHSFPEFCPWLWGLRHLDRTSWLFKHMAESLLWSGWAAERRGARGKRWGERHLQGMPLVTCLLQTVIPLTVSQ